MKRINIDLKKLSDEVLAGIASETDDYDVLFELYSIGKERNSNKILVGILKNLKPETKETVDLIAKYARKEFQITDLNNIIKNKEDSGKLSFYNVKKEKLEEHFVQVKYDEDLKDYIANNPYTSVDTLIDMLVWGELTPILNSSLPNDTLNAFLVSKSSLPSIQNNPMIIAKLIDTLSYKLSDETLFYLQKVPFVDDTYDTNFRARDAYERRQAFRMGISKVKKNVIESF